MHKPDQKQCISKGSVPLIDLNPFIDGTDEDSVVKQVASACQHVGFFGICRHGVSSHIMENLCTASRSFFDLPKIEKEAATSTNANEYPYGYEAMENLALTKEKDTIMTQDEISDNTVPSVDIKETFSLGPKNPASGMPTRKIPSNPPSLEPALSAYYSAMEGLAHTLAQIMALALDQPRNYFLEKMDHHQCALRLLNYPSVQEEPGFLRAGAHTDYGAFTLLKSGGPGLQVYLQQDSHDSDSNPLFTWTDIPESWHDKNSILVVNLGDMMQRWTNGTYTLSQG
jgi:isopenicillin N synthase-like dioxygenase